MKDASEWPEWTVAFTFTDGVQCHETAESPTSAGAILNVIQGMSLWEWRELEAKHGQLVKVEAAQL